MQVDPLTESQESQSVYQYGWNNPILRSDPNGTYPGGPGDDGFLVARLITTAFFDTKHAIINTAARAFNSDIRAGYKVDGDGNQTFETQISRQAVDNSLSGQVREAVNAVGDVALVATAGSSPANPGNLLSKTSVESQVISTIKYEVGTFKDLKSRSAVGDALDIHHVPQKNPAGQTVAGYDPSTAPSIALPEMEHLKIPTQRGTATMSPRSQLAKDVRDLRSKTQAPNSGIQQLINLNKSIYPESFFKKP